MEGEGTYSILEGELRQSLLRGYSRLRRAQAQGRHLNEAERVLELLGDPQVLALENPKQNWKIRIPLVFVSSWDLHRGRKVREVVSSQMDNGLTLYKRRHDDDESDRCGIHSKIISALKDYLTESEQHGGMLLDTLWAPRIDERDHTEATTENWSGFYSSTESPHWLFSNVLRPELPDHVWHIHSLIRLTFPLYLDSKSFPFKMITLILGLAFDPLGDVLSDEIARRRIRWIRRLARIVMDDIPYLNKKIESRQTVKVTPFYPPEWLREPQRDALHTAVDDLHRRVADLANREGAASWHEPYNGFNFLIAFKELDEDREYLACLRYRLTVYNLHALGAQHSSLESWRQELREGVKSNESQLQDAFYRGSRNGGPEAFQVYLADCYKSIDEMTAGMTSLDQGRRAIAEVVEATPYPMRLTPGYHVMNLSHPEIIRHWLQDPRARNFGQRPHYPERLLAWETTVLPERIYYSQIADASLPIGICGVNAELLDLCPAYYELQEIIDESGPRLRYILCEDESAKLRKELREALGRTVRDEVWDCLLRRFRRLAYYFLSSPLDYHTKLVKDHDIRRFSERWRTRKEGNWWELHDLQEGEDVRILIQAPHIPLKESWYVDRGNTQANTYEDDFLKMYLLRYMDEPKDWSIQNSRLYRIKLQTVEDTSLLVLVPNPQNNDLASELVRHFIRQCEIAAQDYRQVVRKSIGTETPRKDKLYQIFLCYNSDDREAVSTIALRFKEENIEPWFDQWALKPGVPWVDALQEQLQTIKSAAIFVGSAGFGPWQNVEVSTMLRKVVEQRSSIFPVLLPGAAKPKRIPFFLDNYQWIDLNDGGSDPLRRLVEAVKEAE